MRSLQGGPRRRKAPRRLTRLDFSKRRWISLRVLRGGPIRFRTISVALLASGKAASRACFWSTARLSLSTGGFPP